MGNSSNLKPQFVAKFVVKIGGDKGIVKKEKQHLWPQTTPPPPLPFFPFKHSYLHMSYTLFLALLFPKEVCYQKYGCFKSHPNPLVKLPQSPSRIGIRFNLFTRANKHSAKLIDDHNTYKLTTSNFKISRRTIFVIHGFTGKGS